MDVTILRYGAAPVVSKRDVSYCGSNDGSVRITPIDGVPPYTYQLWRQTDDGPVLVQSSTTSSTLTGIREGVYEVKVIDATNCRSFPRAVSIRKQQVPERHSLTPRNSDNCVNGNGSIEVLSWPNALQEGYQRVGDAQWTWSTSHLIQGLSAGDYQIAVRYPDDDRCLPLVFNEIVTITEPVPPSVDVFESSYAHRLAEGLQKQTKHEVEFEVLHSGHPGSEIADFARRIDARLVMMSTHGRSGLKRFTAGSTASAVVRTATCPVVLHRPPVFAMD